MTKYRKKPIVIEAEQFLPDDVSPDMWPVGVYADPSSPTGFSVDTLEGTHQVTPGDFIIEGIKGERYPCKPDIFEATYDRITTDTTEGASDE